MLLETVGVPLLQVALWQKAKVPDHRSALVATLGPGVVVNLLPCHHRQEQPEVSFRGKVGARVTEQFYVNPTSSPLLLWYQWVHRSDPFVLNMILEPGPTGGHLCCIMCKRREPDITLRVIHPLNFVLGLSSISLITFQFEEVCSHLSVIITPSQLPPPPSISKLSFNHQSFVLLKVFKDNL